MTPPTPSSTPAPAPAAVVAAAHPRWLRVWPWTWMVSRHLADYTPAARRLWLAVFLAGSLALAGALFLLTTADSDAKTFGWMAFGLVAVGAASFLPIPIPRTAHSISTADASIFVILATLGPAPMVLAAGLDAAITSYRTSKRLSSRLVSPMAAMGAGAVASATFYAVTHSPLGTAYSHAGLLLGLGCAAFIQFVGTTLPLTAVVLLKRQQPISLLGWLRGTGWFGAITMGTASVAGLLTLNAQLFGWPLIGVTAVMAGASVVLLRTSLAHDEAQRAEQEARLAAARQTAEANQRRFTAAFSHAAVGMAIVGGHGRVLQVNAAMAQLLDTPAEALVDRDFLSLLHPADAPLLVRLMDELGGADEPAVSVQLRFQRSDGAERWVALNCGRFDDPAGNDQRCVIYHLHDITSRREAEHRLQHIAFHDNLTDLPNRACFIERLNLMIERQRQDPALRFAVLFLDLDRFKVVNDSLGHAAGNELLCHVADRLRDEVQQGDLVARLGGDEFAVLCEDPGSPEAACEMASRLSDALCRPLTLEGTEVLPGASIGLTFSDGPSRSAEEILRDADLAMYEAKAGGRGRVAAFDTTMRERIADRLALETDLRHAIGDGSLSAAFQPIYRIDTLQLDGFEALARWQHPQRGWVSPAVFIGVAEDAGHISSLTFWMIDHAVKRLAQWSRNHPGCSALTVNVNVSGRDLANPQLVEHVARTLRQHQLAPARLALEITETVLMTRLDQTMTALQALRDLGVRFSIDDFGTGYSSLAYLGTLPIDSLKIDRSFVSGLQQGAQNAAIVHTVCQLGQTLRKKIVAEGVESPAQLRALHSLGVDCAQGYLLSPPVLDHKVDALLISGTLQSASHARRGEGIAEPA